MSSVLNVEEVPMWSEQSGATVPTPAMLADVSSYLNPVQAYGFDLVDEAMMKMKQRCQQQQQMVYAETLPRQGGGSNTRKRDARQMENAEPYRPRPRGQRTRTPSPSHREGATASPVSARRPYTPVYRFIRDYPLNSKLWATRRSQRDLTGPKKGYIDIMLFAASGARSSTRRAMAIARAVVLGEPIPPTTSSNKPRAAKRAATASARKRSSTKSEDGFGGSNSSIMVTPEEAAELVPWFLGLYAHRDAIAANYKLTRGYLKELITDIPEKTLDWAIRQFGIYFPIAVNPTDTEPPITPPIEEQQEGAFSTLSGINEADFLNRSDEPVSFEGEEDEMMFAEMLKDVAGALQNEQNPLTPVQAFARDLLMTDPRVWLQRRLTVAEGQRDLKWEAVVTYQAIDGSLSTVCFAAVEDEASGSWTWQTRVPVTNAQRGTLDGVSVRLDGDASGICTAPGLASDRASVDLHVFWRQEPDQDSDEDDDGRRGDIHRLVGSGEPAQPDTPEGLDDFDLSRVFDYDITHLAAYCAVEGIPVLLDPSQDDAGRRRAVIEAIGDYNRDVIASVETGGTTSCNDFWAGYGGEATAVACAPAIAAASAV